MRTYGVVVLRLVAAALIAVLLFAPRVRDGGSSAGAGPIARDALARSLAPTGDQAVIKVGRKPTVLKTLLIDRPVVGRLWLAALLAVLLLVGGGGRHTFRQEPSRPLSTLRRRATPRRAPPPLPLT